MITMKIRLIFCFAALFSFGSQAAAKFSDTFFFGDSVSDTGNNAYLLDHTVGLFTSHPLRTSVPIPAPDFVASNPYANDRYSNGPVWAEYFSARLGQSAGPALRGDTNYAFGGAMMGPLGNVLPPSVRDQITSYLATHGNRAAGNALYVIEGGANDARRAADVWISSGDPAPIVADYVRDALASIAALQSAGARDILFWNIPDMGKTPEFLLQGAEASAKATGISSAMNQAMLDALETFAPDHKRDLLTFDVFGFMNQVFKDPAAFGLVDVTTACAYSIACIANPTRSLFWDGLHPTTAGHALLASAALASVNPEPEIYLLFGVGLAAVAWHRRKRAVVASASEWQSA